MGFPNSNFNTISVGYYKLFVYFQNLPELETLDLAYNKLTTFDFDYFDQVKISFEFPGPPLFTKLRDILGRNTIITSGEHESQ